MTEPTPPADSVPDAALKRAWLDAVKELADHINTCSECRHGEDCSAYATLDAAERTAWSAHARAQMATP